MKNRPLFDVIIEMIEFLTSADDNCVQPDVAVKQLESIATILRDLDDLERRAFIDYVKSCAEYEQAQIGRTARAEFLAEIPENLGLE